MLCCHFIYEDHYIELYTNLPATKNTLEEIMKVTRRGRSCFDI